MPKKYYISDTHFGHDKIIEFECHYRPFNSITEHDEELIDRWNNVVNKRDIVMHLGDVAFKPASTMDIVMPKLNGIKKLVLGNHDTANINLYLKYFTKVYSAHEDKKNGLLFTHYPVHESQLGHRYLLNIHGHLHSKKINDPRYINISCEHTRLTPIGEEELRERFPLWYTARIGDLASSL